MEPCVYPRVALELIHEHAQLSNGEFRAGSDVNDDIPGVFQCFAAIHEWAAEGALESVSGPRLSVALPVSEQAPRIRSTKDGREFIEAYGK